MRAMVVPTRRLRAALTNSLPERHTLGCVVVHLIREVRRIGLRRTLEVWHQRGEFRRDIRRLLQAGPHLIDDIGLSEEEARAEIGTPVWLP